MKLLHAGLARLATPFLLLSQKKWGKEKATTCRFNPQFIIPIGRQSNSP
jgi:hypothetical protein